MHRPGPGANHAAGSCTSCLVRRSCPAGCAGTVPCDGGCAVNGLREMWRRLIGLSLLALVLCSSGCAGTAAPAAPTVARPTNLSDAKRQVTEYIDSGRYDTDLAAVAEQARAFL